MKSETLKKANLISNEINQLTEIIEYIKKAQNKLTGKSNIKKTKFRSLVLTFDDGEKYIIDPTDIQINKIIDLIISDMRKMLFKLQEEFDAL